MNKSSTFLQKFWDFLTTPLGFIVFRIIILLLTVSTFISLLVIIKETFPYINESSKNTNLGVLISSLQNNWKAGALVSFIMCGISLVIIGITATLTNLISNPLWIKLIAFSYFGVMPIVFIFTMVLISTKPSDNTLIFSILSAIGASTAFCFTVYMSLKK